MHESTRIPLQVASQTHPRKTFPAHHSVSIFSCKQPQSLPRSRDQPVTLGVRGDFTADGLDQMTLCSQSPGFGTPAAPVQVLFKETESGQSTRVSKLTIIIPDTERK
ncbi:hypothetical protein STEG23_023469 [Scotinomys teguina]